MKLTDLLGLPLDTALEIAKRVLSDDSFRDIYSDASLPQFGEASDNRK